MEEYKETAAEQANFSDLPNELLREIFHHLGHSDLLRMSLVNRRWHQVIFHFLNDRFWFRPTACNGLHGHRTYRHLDLSACPLPLPTLDDSCDDYFYTDRTQLERQNIDEARSIRIKTVDLRLDLLARLLINFRNLASLDLDASGKVQFSYIMRIKGDSNDSMAQVKHLKIKAKVSVLKHVLRYVSQCLVTLHMVLSPKTLDFFCGNNFTFPNLETLKVELDRTGRLDLDDTLKIFLERLPKLRKFSFAMYDPSAFQEVTEANTNIEEFELLGLTDYLVPDMSEMKNLKIFRTDANFLHFNVFDPEPVPQLTRLDIDQATFVDFSGLVENFPNLTTLLMAELPTSSTDLTILVAAYPALQVLSIRIPETFAEMLKLISDGFTKLIELRVKLAAAKDLEDGQAREIAKGNLSIFGGVLGIPTLLKLYIKTNLFTDETIPSISLPQKCPNCRVFVNDLQV